MTTYATRTWTGRGALAEAGPRLADLLVDQGAPVDARAPWLGAIAACDDGPEPWVVALEDAAGELTAAAILGRRRSRTGWVVTGLGHGMSDRTRLPTRTPDAAGPLAAAVAEGLHELDGAWVLHLEQLPVDDAVSAALAELLPATRWDPGDGCPVWPFADGRDPRSYLSKSTRGNFRNMRNRLDRDGHAPAIRHLRSPGEVAPLLPRLERIHRDQDAFLNRRTRFDDPAWRCGWRNIILAHAERGELELNVLDADGDVAAYCVCFLDGPTYRYWNVAFDPVLRAYSPGTTLWVATVEHLLEDTDCTVFDFMRGEEDYKLQHTDAVEPTRELAAASSRPLLAAARAPGRARELVNRARDRNDAVDRAVDRLKRVIRRNGS